MADNEGLEFDRSVLGVEVDVGELGVTREQIAAFCRAVGETNPLYTDDDAAAKGPFGGIVAPPAFFTAITTTQGLNPKVTFGEFQLNAGQRCEFLEPIRPGDTIKARTAVKDVFEKTGRSGRMAFIVRRTTYRNQRGAAVVVVEHSVVVRKTDR